MTAVPPWGYVCGMRDHMNLHWHDGVLKIAPESGDLTSPAFRYGAGFFETLFWNGSQAWLLDAHVGRLHAGLAAFGFSAAPCDYAAAIRAVVMALELEGRPGRINIYAPIEDENGPVKPRIVVAPWTPPEPDRVWRISALASAETVPACHPPLAEHKTMNYMYHWLLRRQAARRGYDDVLLPHAAGLALETTAAALVCGDGSRLYVPAGGPRLPSVTLAAAQAALPMTDMRIRPADLARFRHIYALNALNGMLPVTAVEDMIFAPDFEVCRKARPLLLGLEARVGKLGG